MEKTNVQEMDKWNASSYEGNGLYHNKSESNEDLVFVENGSVWTIPASAIQYLESESKVDGISEQTHLKTIALLTGRELK